MEPLEALRAAIARGEAVSVEGTGAECVVVLGDARRPGLVPTALRSARTGKAFDLATLAFYWPLRAQAWNAYFKQAKDAKVGFIVVGDVKQLQTFLGAGEGATGPDVVGDVLQLVEDDDEAAGAAAPSASVSTSVAAAAAAAALVAAAPSLTAAAGAGDAAAFLSSSSSSASSSSSSSSLSLASFAAASTDTLVSASHLDLAVQAALSDHMTLGDIRREVQLRSPANVLEALGRNVKDGVYKLLASTNERQSLALASVSSKRPALGAASTASDAAAKRAKSAVAGAVAMSAAMQPAASAIDRAKGQAELFAAMQGSTPIIIVPPSATSPINIHNVASFLGKLTWEAPAAALQSLVGAKPTKVTITRTDWKGNACSYHVTDNVAALERKDWLKVVAIFAAGPEWQFKGWKWGEKPRPGPPDAEGRPTAPSEAPDLPIVKIFSRALGFHVYFEGEAPHPNCQEDKWAVTNLPISKTKRYLDAGVVNRFWQGVDKFVWTRAPFLLPRGAVLPGAAAAGEAGGGGATPG